MGSYVAQPSHLSLRGRLMNLLQHLRGTSYSPPSHILLTQHHGVKTKYGDIERRQGGGDRLSVNTALRKELRLTKIHHIEKAGFYFFCFSVSPEIQVMPASPDHWAACFPSRSYLASYDFSRKTEHFSLETSSARREGERVTLPRLPLSLWSHLEAKKVSGCILMMMELRPSED